MKITKLKVKTVSLLTTPKEAANQAEKVGFLKKLKLIVFGKKDTGEQLTIAVFATLLYVFFFIAAILGIFIGLIFGFETVANIFKMQWFSLALVIKNILSIAFNILLTLFTLLLSSALFGVAHEVKRSQDKTLIFAVFSCVISLVALIVACN